MLIGIDHLVIVVADPDAAASALEREVGLAFTGGGRHEHAGTFNRLAFLGDSYVELIGVFDRALVLSNTAFAVGQASLAFLEERGEGLATWAVASDNVAVDAARLQAGGSPIAAPVAGSRTRPDGEVVRWWTAFPPLGPAQPPFLITHELTGAEWGDDARAARARFQHPAGGQLRMAGLDLSAPNPAAAAAQFEHWSGLGFGPDGIASMGAQTVTLRPAGGGRDDLPVVSIEAADATSAALDVIRFGVRWQRGPRRGYPARHG